MNDKDIKLADVVWMGIGAPFYIGVLGGFVILARQGIVLIRRGEWTPFSGVDLLHHTSDSTWLVMPTDWIGIHKALEWVHGGLFAAIVGGCISFALLLVLAPLLEPKK